MACGSGSREGLVRRATDWYAAAGRGPQIAQMNDDVHTAAAESGPLIAQMNGDFVGARERGELTGRVIGVFFDVYNELGFGHLESVYRRAMLVALVQAGIPAASDVPIDVRFRGVIVGRFRADLIVDNSLVVEAKSVRVLEPIHEAQLLNYLRSTRLELGLLLNFGHTPKVRRLAYSNTRKSAFISVHQRPPHNQRPTGGS